MLLCASCDRSGRSAWPELAPGLTPDSIKQKYPQTVVSTRIVPGCVQFWGGKNVFTQPGSKADVRRTTAYGPLSGQYPSRSACLKGARTGPYMPFYEESDATRAARLFRLAYGRRLRCLLKAHSGVGADAPEHNLVPVMAWRGFVPAHGSRDARYVTIARRSCSSRLATTWTINGLHSPVRAPCWKS